MLDLSKLNEFIKAITSVCGCKTPGLGSYMGKQYSGLGGCSVSYVCTGCSLQCGLRIYNLCFSDCERGWGAQLGAGAHRS